MACAAALARQRRRGAVAPGSSAGAGAHPLRHRRAPGLPVLALLALFLPAPALAAPEEEGAAARREAARLVHNAVPGAISGLLDAVAAGDDAGKTRLAARLTRELEALAQAVGALPAVALERDAESSWRLASLHPGVDAGEAAAQVRATPGWREGVAALRANVVSHLALGGDDGTPWVLAYYPPRDRLLALERMPHGAASGGAPGGPEAASHRPPLAALSAGLEAAWRSGTAVPLPGSGGVAGEDPGGGAHPSFTFVDTGVVALAQGRRPADRLREVARQLAYIVQVKAEGPPLLAATRANLFFDGEFGFMAWGGRWPAFADKVFMLRYDPRRQAFLVRVAALAAVLDTAPP